MNEREYEAGLAPTPGYRYAERVGAQLFVAGQVPVDGTGAIVGRNDARRQAEQCLANLATLIGCHDFQLRHIRRLQISVAGGRAALLEAWSGVRSWFADDVPPATLVGVRALGYEGQLVEIDATVVDDTN
jgi:enamine deaminase RidA (YjgF/YER057c/UK114 family)